MRVRVVDDDGLARALSELAADVEVTTDVDVAVDVAADGAADGAESDRAESVEGAGVDVVVLRVPDDQDLLRALAGRVDPPLLLCRADAGAAVEALEAARAAGATILFEPVEARDIVRVLPWSRPAAGSRTATGGGAAVPDAMAGLWAKFRGTMVERLDVLEEMAVALLDQRDDPELRKRAHGAAHKLHGALGTFGRGEGSAIAAQLEALLEAPSLDPGQVYRFSELTVMLREALDRSGDEAPSVGEPGTSPPDPSTAAWVVILEPDDHLGQRLLSAALARGLAASVARTVPEARAEVARRSEAASDSGGAGAADRVEDRVAGVVVIDPAAGEAAAVTDLLEALAVHQPPIAVLIHTDRATLSERVRATALGARAFLAKPMDPSTVLARAADLLRPTGGRSGVVLAVDDDPAVLEAVRRALAGGGTRVRTLNEPLNFWRTLEAVRPDVLLLDVDMPGINGIQLCRVVRADPRWSELPVVFLTARAEREVVLAAFQAGADDFIRKPFVGPELRARVQARLAPDQRARERADERSGLPSRAAAMERLAAMLGLAARFEVPVAVCLLDIAGADGAEGQEADSVIRSAVERIGRNVMDGDLVAAWSETELLVCRYGLAGDQARQWLRDGFPDEGLGSRFRAGVAAFPADGRDAAALLDLAVAGMGTGTGTGSGSDSGSGSESESGTGPASGREQKVCDVLVVEDDEALGTLLVQTLEDRDIEVHWIRDGLEALRLLTGERPAVRARVILLDVGLPGLDGLTLLGQLTREGTTRRTRVLMLTARSAETEVVRALELGAFDHVPKPFSVRELVERVRRALEDRRAG